MERRRGMMGADEANGLKDKELTPLSGGSYEVMNNTVYIYPTVRTFVFIDTPFKKNIRAKQGDVLRIKGVSASSGFYADFRVRTSNGLVVVNENFMLNKNMNISKTIKTDCEISALYFAARTASITFNWQGVFAVFINDNRIF